MIESCAVVRPLVLPVPDAPKKSERLLELIEEKDGGNTTAGKGSTKDAKDDRTWLQKNWLFVALAFFIIANKLGNAVDPQQQGSRTRGT